MSQRVLITAGAGGIGLAIAKAFVANGARVHIADVNAAAVAAILAENENITGSGDRNTFTGDAGRIFPCSNIRWKRDAGNS